MECEHSVSGSHCRSGGGSIGECDRLSGPSWLLGALQYTLSKKTDVAHYNLNTDQPILIIFGRDVAERVLSNGVIFLRHSVVVLTYTCSY